MVEASETPDGANGGGEPRERDERDLREPGHVREPRRARRDLAPVIQRSDTGIRVLITIVMSIIWGVLRPVLAICVAFSLIWALVTQSAPPLRVRQLSNRLVAYSYQIWRYITYNTPDAPFPFSDFPESLEPPEPIGADSARAVKQLFRGTDEEATADHA